MSIIKLTNSKYTGSSSDIKPRNAGLGASFYEYDTEFLYDKTLNINNGLNGWVKRVAVIEGGGSSSDTLKNAITTKFLGGNSYLVIMAGTDTTNFELGDIVLGRKGSKLIVGEVTSLPVTTVDDLGIAMQGGTGI